MLRQWRSHGYELMERTVELGFESINPGTVYRTLRKMEKDGLCRSEWETTSSGGPARRVYSITYNGMIDKHPRLIACCSDVADVISGVNFARENEVLLAVRGGGHNGGGLGVADDGLVIDLSAMRGVRVDPDAQTVRVEGGATWTTPPTLSGWPSPPASSLPPA